MDAKKTKKQTGDIDKIKNETEEYKNKYLRVLADYHNLEKRVNEDKLRIANQANSELVLRLLPFLDNIEKAQIFLKDEGLRLIKDQLLQVLEKEGLEEIKIMEEEFDPEVAEAVDIIEGEKDNTVVEVYRKGYKFKGRVIRPAQVRVSKKN